MSPVTGWPHEWVEDHRSPLFTFRSKASTEYEFYFASVLWWLDVLFYALVFALLIAAPLSVLVYFTIVRPRKIRGRRSAVWFWGYGVLLPFLVAMPVRLFSFLQIRSGTFRFLLLSTPMMAIFRILAAMYDFAPAHATRSLPDYMLYFSSPMLLSHDNKTGRYIPTSSRKIFKIFSRFQGFQFITGAYQSLFYQFPSIFPSLNPSLQFPGEGHYTLRELFSLHCVKDSFFLAVLIMLYLCTFGESLVFFISLITQKQVEPFMDNPIFASESPSDFWGRRWNLLVHDCLKNGVYKPVRSMGGSKVVAVAASFLASGILHEWVVTIIFAEHKEFYWNGRQTAFFLWQGLLVAGEALVGHWNIFKRMNKLLPTYVKTGLIIMLGIPLAPWFFEPYQGTGFYFQAHTCFPVIFRKGSFAENS